MALGLPPLRIGSARNDAAWERHNRGIAQWGVYREPSPELCAQAIAYAEAVWDVWKWTGATAADRAFHVEQNRLGIIGAELIANYWQQHADWTVYPGNGPNWDMTLHLGTIDAKTRPGFLTLPGKDLRKIPQPTYYGLVQHFAQERGYTLCGVITPEAFLRAAEPMHYGRDRLLGVTAFELQGLIYLPTEGRA